MKQKTKIILIVTAGLVVAGLLVYFLFFFGKSKSSVADGDSVASGKYTDDRFPLKRNSGGDNVRALQTCLNVLLTQKNETTLVVDGKFGAKTEEALKTLTGFDSVNENQFNNIKALAASASK